MQKFNTIQVFEDTSTCIARFSLYFINNGQNANFVDIEEGVNLIVYKSKAINNSSRLLKKYTSFSRFAIMFKCDK